MTIQAVDMASVRVGMLVVLRRSRRRGGGTWWLTKCDCGATKEVRASHLVQGRIKSCGCSTTRMMIASKGTHGMTNTPEFRAWAGMITRCTNPNDKGYPRWGGRGITICHRWRKSFKTFYADVGQRPSNEHSLERIRNNEGYKPGNVRWATPTEQARNTRRNRKVRFQGRTASLAEWAENSKIDYGVLLSRLQRGWSPVRMLSTPVKPSRRHIRIGGLTHTVAQWAKKIGITVSAMRYRLRSGASGRDLLRPSWARRRTK